MASFIAIVCSLKLHGKNKMKLIIPITTFIQPVIVYILNGRPTKYIVLSPSGVTAACKPGPTTNPKT